MASLKVLNRIGLGLLAYGVFLVLYYLYEAYSVLWRGEFRPLAEARRAMQAPSPYAVILSPNELILLLTGLLLIVTGYYLLKHVREREIKDTKDFVISTILTEDEKLVVTGLRESGGSMTQTEISRKFSFSPVKTYRILMRLEKQGLVKSYPHGMTKKIVLNNHG